MLVDKLGRTVVEHRGFLQRGTTPRDYNKIHTIIGEELEK